MRLSDSTVLYQLYFIEKLTITDTAAMKDSLQNYFQKPVKILPLHK
jgi:hypothetical protein